MDMQQEDKMSKLIKKNKEDLFCYGFLVYWILCFELKTGKQISVLNFLVHTEKEKNKILTAFFIFLCLPD